MTNLPLEKAYEILDNYPSKYLIIGFMSDGRRGIPFTYQVGVVGCNDDTLHATILSFEKGRVFLMDEIGKWPEWKERALKDKKEKDQESEKQIYLRLKEKYEKNG